MPEYPCHVVDCEFKTPNVADALAAVQMNHHLLTEHPPTPTVQRTTSKAPPIERPNIEAGCNEETWQIFNQKWKLFRSGAQIEILHRATQLFNCCETSLQNNLMKENANIANLNETQLLAAIKNLAVIPVAVGIRRADLLAMSQDVGENARSFHARVRGKADICSYTAKCSCTLDVNFTDVIVKDVLVAGLSDEDIRREVLGWSDLDTASIAQTIKFIEGKEMARDAMVSGAAKVGAMSSFKKNNKSDNKSDKKTDEKPDGRTEEQKEADLKKPAACPGCGQMFNLFKKMGRSGKLNKSAFQKCRDCFVKEKESTDGKSSFSSVMLFGGIGISPTSRLKFPKYNKINQNLVHPGASKVTLEHQIFEEYLWRPVRNQNHPKMAVRMEFNSDDYENFGMSCPSAGSYDTVAVTDTGAQVCLYPRRDLYKLNMSRTELFPVKRKIIAANRSPISIDGAMLIRFKGKCGELPVAAAMIYVSPDVSEVYLSKHVQSQLEVISKNFPTIGDHGSGKVAGVKTEDAPASVEENKSENNGVKTEESTASMEENKPENNEVKTEDFLPSAKECNCPKRVLPPGKPSSLPFSCRPENNGRMKAYLLQQYGSSTFNKCPHQILSLIHI